MIKLTVRIILTFCFWMPKPRRQSFKVKLYSFFYSYNARKKAKSLGKNVKFQGAGVSLSHWTVVGDDSGFGGKVSIRGDGPVTIGKGVAIAEGTIIYSQVHDYDTGDDLPFGKYFTYPEIRIDDYVWIGLYSIILPGAHIGEGAIVQAGSVVMGEVPPCAIVGGNPAKVIGYRDFDHYNKLKVAKGEKPVEPPKIAAKSAAKKVVSSANELEGNDRLTDVFTSTFSVSPEEALTMRYKDHPAWDSAGQMALTAALEAEFGVKITPQDLYHLRSYADAMKLIGIEAEVEEEKGEVPVSDVEPIFDLTKEGIAVIDNDREVSYAELKKLSDDAVRGLKPHTVKLIVNHQDANTLAMMVGCFNYGIVPLMVPEKMEKSLLEKLREMYEGKPTNKDLALLLTTSGSTGSPKLVRISRDNIKEMVATESVEIPIKSDERALINPPLCHVYGVCILTTTLVNGGTVVLTRYSVGDPELREQLMKHKVTLFTGVPYMYEILDKLEFFKERFPSLRTFMTAGAAMAPALKRKYALWGKESGVHMHGGYGQTETCGGIANINYDENLERLDSIGTLAKIGGKLKTVEGELVYEGPKVALGYAENAADLLKGDEWKGVRHTGDLAKIAEDGFVTLTGRAARFVKIFGNRVSLDEVEHLIKDNFEGVQAAAMGGDNDLRIFTTSPDVASVEKFLVKTLHFNTTVMKVRHLGEIPLNANGKIDYSKLKKIEV